MWSALQDGSAPARPTAPSSTCPSADPLNRWAPTNGIPQPTGGRHPASLGNGVSHNEGMSVPAAAPLTHASSGARGPVRGFTLVEIMIALILLGILTAIALPAYQSHVAKGRRAEAINALSAVLQAQERWRSNRSSYASTLSDLGYADTTSPL